MKADRLLLLTPLREALERIARKAEPLLADPSLLDQEDGQDRLDVICMQFLAAGEALKRLEKLEPGLLATNFPEIDWKGAMGFRDVIAHQYFDLDVEDMLDALICAWIGIEHLEGRTIGLGDATAAIWVPASLAG